MIEDLEAFLADFGVPVVLGVESGLGILNTPDELYGSGQGLSTEYQVTVKTAAFPTADSGDAITVDGVSYAVRDVRKIDDGAFSVFRLSLP